MTIFAGIELLTIAPNSVTQWGSSTSRPTRSAVNPQGNVVVTTTQAIARGSRSLEWTCLTRADLLALTAFLDNRRGQLTHCWIPSYQPDVEVLEIRPFFGTIVTATPFSAMLVAMPAWRYWFARNFGGALYETRYVDLSEDLLDGTHVWRGSFGAGPGDVGTIVDQFSVTSANGFMWSRLHRCRMASDSYRVRYLGKQAVVTADFTEVVAP